MIVIKSKSDGVPGVLGWPVVETKNQGLGVVDERSGPYFTTDDGYYERMVREVIVIMIHYYPEGEIGNWRLIKGYVNPLLEREKTLKIVAHHGDTLYVKDAMGIMEKQGITIYDSEKMEGLYRH